MYTFTTIDAFLGVKDSRPLGRNTKAQRRGSDIAVTLYSTDILTFSPCGKVTISSGGYCTNLTRDRINANLKGAYVYTEKGKWYIHEENREAKPFVDGMFTYQ